MGALSDFIAREFAGATRAPEIKIENRAAAIPAIPAIRATENSQNSQNSRGPDARFNPEALQAEADARNVRAKHEGRTDRYCRCGRLAECAWPLEGGRELWRCFECLPAGGRA